MAESDEQRSGRGRHRKDVLELQLGREERKLLESIAVIMKGGDLTKIEHRLAIIIGLLEHPVEDEPEVYFNQVRIDGIVIGGILKMAQLREGQFIPVSVAFRTANNKPAVYEAGTATWVSSDPAVASVEVDPANELAAKVIGVDGSNNASAIIEFRADGDPDADQTRELIATLDVVVTQGEAVVAELTAAAAEDNPTIPTPGPEPEPEPTTPAPEEPPVPSEPAPESTP